MKNILITGISRGVGLIIAGLLLRHNYNVYGISRTITPGLEKLKSDFYEKIKLLNFDLQEANKISKGIFKDFINLQIPIHGFINNAAYAYDDIVSNINLEQLEKMFRVNVYSPMLISKNVIRNMLLHQIAGSIIHISSISVHTGYKGLAMYASTKGALEAFSKNTAREWGPRKIRSNCIVAGFMETDMSATLTDEQKEKIYRRTSLKAATEVVSVAETVLFLLSEKSASITGQNIFVDSGTI